MAIDERLRLIAEALGFDESVNQLNELRDAQREVAGAQGQEGVAAATKLDDAQEQLNATTEDYVGILNRIHPRLGEYANAARRALNVAGELSTKNLSLNSILEEGAGALSKYAGALALLGAGAVAVGGLSILIGKIREVRSELAESRKAMDAFNDALTTSQQTAQQGAASVAAGRARRGLTPFTAAQQTSVAQTLQAAPADIRDGLQPILEALGGATGFGPGGGEFSGAELEDLARLGFAVPERGSQQRITQRARRFLARNATRAAQLRQTQADLRAQQQQAAGVEALDASGGQANLRAIVEEVAAERGIDPNVLFELSEAETQRFAREGRNIGRLPPLLAPGAGYRTRPGVETFPFIESAGRQATPIEAAAVDQVRTTIINIIQNNGRYTNTTGIPDNGEQRVLKDSVGP